MFDAKKYKKVFKKNLISKEKRSLNLFFSKKYLKNMPIVNLDERKKRLSSSKKIRARQKVRGSKKFKLEKRSVRFLHIYCYYNFVCMTSQNLKFYGSSPLGDSSGKITGDMRLIYHAVTLKEILLLNCNSYKSDIITNKLFGVYLF